MKYTIIITIFICSAVNAMDTKEQLKAQLRDITFNGKYDAFTQQPENFAQQLDPNDILKAQHHCDARLMALQDLEKMYINTHIKDLVAMMQAEMKTSKMGVFAYVDEKGREAKYNSTSEMKDTFEVAARILLAIEFRSNSFTGNYLIDLQEKLVNRKKPLKFIKREIDNTTQLQSALQRTFRNKVGYQLHQIVFNGDYEAFQQNQRLFKRTLDILDLVRAQENCKFRLFAIESIRKMRTNPRFNLLVMSMEQDQEPDEGTSIGKYCQHYPFDEVRAAREIDNVTCQHSAIYNGCFAEIQEKIVNQSDPEQYLEKEKQNILQLRDALQKSLPDVPQELINHVQRYGTLKFTKDYFSIGE